MVLPPVVFEVQADKGSLSIMVFELVENEISNDMLNPSVDELFSNDSITGKAGVGDSKPVESVKVNMDRFRDARDVLGKPYLDIETVVNNIICDTNKLN